MKRKGRIEQIVAANARLGVPRARLYKLGWSLYKQDFYDEALHHYMALLDYKLSVGYDFDQQHAEEDERRVADTFRVISLSFSNLGGPEVISEYYSTNGSRSYEDRIYQNLGEFYFDKLRYNDAAAVYDSFVERYPYHRAAPEFGMRVVGIYQAGDFPKLVVESKKSFATKYGLQSEYWQHFDSAERPEVLAYLKTNLQDLANHYHALYQEKVSRRKSRRITRRRWSGTAHSSRRSRRTRSRPASTTSSRICCSRTATSATRRASTSARLTSTLTHERASAAGYAAIFAHREQLKAASRGATVRPQACDGRRARSGSRTRSPSTSMRPSC